jgi:ATP-dependent helicase/nuclease subunit B
LNNRTALLNEMANGAWVITPNNRLSHQLLRDYMRLSSKKVLDKPCCLPYPSLLRTLFKQTQHAYATTTHPVLYNAHQERLLWQLILSNNSPYPYTESLMNEVQDAWTRCQLWSIDINSADFSQTPQMQQFQTWHQTFMQNLSTHHAITESLLVPYLIQFPIDSLPERIIWVSFDDFSPQQQQLQITLESRGIIQQVVDLEATQRLPNVYAAKDTEDEQHQLLIWLQTQLDAAVARVAVIVPDLHLSASNIERRLLKNIPASQFELSVGKGLSEYPLVAHALHWLALDKNAFAPHQLRLLLHSPYLGHSCSEFARRSALLENVQLFQEERISYLNALQIFKRQAPQLAEALEQLTEYPQQASPSEWVAHFKARLTALGFPGEYTLPSSVYQCLQRFQSLFDEFLSLGLISKQLSQIDALNAIQNIARNTVFQVRKTPAPIQILGLLEASGCEFDAIWVMGLTDQCLPQKVKLSPFIPLSIQRERDMPHAKPERESRLAQQLLMRLHYGSQHSVFSYPLFIGDTPQLQSPLIREFPSFTPMRIKPSCNTIALTAYQESYQCTWAEAETLSGGTSVLAYQAQCPFRAFAAYRLRAKTCVSPSVGLDEATRGQMVHRILEIIWKSLGSHQTLCLTSASDLEQLIETAINNTFTPVIERHPYALPPLIQSIERERLTSLMLNSLDWERQRAGFTIKALEEAFTLQLAGLDFSVRVDRLDTVSDGETWVIDYKSTLPPSKPWYEERPEAPQLLLYALLDSEINTLAFLQVKTAEIACSGISQNDSTIQGIGSLKKDETWEGMREAWHTRLTGLATELREGHCAPTPQKTSTCLKCDYKNLCRT